MKENSHTLFSRRELLGLIAICGLSGAYIWLTSRFKYVDNKDLKAYEDQMHVYLQKTATATTPESLASLPPIIFSNSLLIHTILEQNHPSQALQDSGTCTALETLNIDHRQYLLIATAAHLLVGEQHDYTTSHVFFTRPQTQDSFSSTIDDSGAYATSRFTDFGLLLVHLEDPLAKLPSVPVHITNNHLNTTPLTGLGFPDSSYHPLVIKYQIPQENGLPLFSPNQKFISRPALSYFGVSGMGLFSDQQELSAIAWALNPFKDQIIICQIPTDFLEMRQSVIDYVTQHGISDNQIMPSNYSHKVSRRNFLRFNY